LIKITKEEKDINEKNKSANYGSYPTPQVPIQFIFMPSAIIHKDFGLAGIGSL
jgi:hypothetical protein